MTLATDMGGVPIVGGLARFNPATLAFPTWPGLSFQWPGPYAMPFAQHYAVGLNSATAAQASDRIVVRLPTSSNHFAGVVNQIPLPAVPYTIDIAFCMAGVTGTGVTINGVCGIFLYDGTKIKEYSVGATNSQYHSLVETWTNLNTAVAAQHNVATVLNRGLMFLRICDNGANRTYWQSSNGRDYLQIFSEATNTFLTPTQWGIGGVQNLIAGPGSIKASVYHALVSPGVLGDLP